MGQDLREPNASLRLEQPGRGVEGDEAVEPTRVDEDPALVQAGVAVGAAAAVGKEGSQAPRGSNGGRSHGGHRVLRAGRPEDAVAMMVRAAPGEIGLGLFVQTIRRAHRTRNMRPSTTIPSMNEGRSLNAKETGSSCALPYAINFHAHTSECIRTEKACYSQPAWA